MLAAQYRQSQETSLCFQVLLIVLPRELILRVGTAEQGEANMVMTSRLYPISLEYRHHISVARISLRCKVGACRLQERCS